MTNNQLNNSSNQEGYFYCYNSELRKYLGFVGGLRWEHRGIHTSTGKRFWTFLRTKRLDELLHNYKNSD